MSRITIDGDPWPFRIAAASPDRGLAVAIEKQLYEQGGGVLAATPTVTLPDGSTQALAPIYLVIEAGDVYC